MCGHTVKGVPSQLTNIHSHIFIFYFFGKNLLPSCLTLNSNCKRVLSARPRPAAQTLVILGEGKLGAFLLESGKVLIHWTSVFLHFSKEISRRVSQTFCVCLKGLMQGG